MRFFGLLLILHETLCVIGCYVDFSNSRLEKEWHQIIFTIKYTSLIIRKMDTKSIRPPADTHNWQFPSLGIMYYFCTRTNWWWETEVSRSQLKLTRRSVKIATGSCYMGVLHSLQLSEFAIHRCHLLSSKICTLPVKSQIMAVWHFYFILKHVKDTFTFNNSTHTYLIKGMV